MANSGNFYRILAFLKHFFTSWNTTGEGIHSPYLFELVRFILRDENAYYCFADIERRREMLLACEDTLEVVDFGSQDRRKVSLFNAVCAISRRHIWRVNRWDRHCSDWSIG